MTMITYDLKVQFPEKSKVGNPQNIYLEMDWIHRNTTPDFCKYFGLTETGENISMMTLRKKVKLEAFLDYHGHTFTESLARFRLLKSRNELRLASDDKNMYINIGIIDIFYREVEAGNKPEYIDLACIEHY